VKKSIPARNAESQVNEEGVDLSVIAKRKDLYWVKRQVILRCDEITQKLTI
jgi:hypothetical protein